MVPASISSTHSGRHRPAVPHGYIYCPKALITECTDLPHATGVYLVIGRQFLLNDGRPVPLSASDLQRYDPTLSISAAVRALNRLVRTGWLLETAQCGRKSHYLPTWGPGKGALQPWQFHTAALGRPAGVRSICVDERLLDTCIGKIKPHPCHRAVIARFLSQPTLSLEEVGLYARAQGVAPVCAPRLARLGLLQDGRVCTLPAGKQLLALLSQHAAINEQSNLTPEGLRQFGVEPQPSAPQGVAPFLCHLAMSTSMSQTLPVT